MPSVDFADDDEGTTVELPTDFDFTSVTFHLDSIDQEAIDAWASDVAEEDAQFIPTDYAMLGCIEHNPDGTDFEFGVGLALSSWSEGILAYMDQSGEETEFSTYFYSVEAAETANF